MTATVFGSGIRRREDPRLITGTAAYTDDIVLPPHGACSHPSKPARSCADQSASTRPLPKPPQAFLKCSPPPIPKAALEARCRARGSCRTPTSRSPRTRPSPPRSRSDMSAIAWRLSWRKNRYQAQDALDLIEVERRATSGGGRSRSRG